MRKKGQGFVNLFPKARWCSLNLAFAFYLMALMGHQYCNLILSDNINYCRTLFHHYLLPLSAGSKSDSSPRPESWLELQRPLLPASSSEQPPLSFLRLEEEKTPILRSPLFTMWDPRSKMLPLLLVALTGVVTTSPLDFACLGTVSLSFR